MPASDTDGVDTVGDIPISVVESPEFKGGIPMSIEGIAGADVAGVEGRTV